MQRNLSDARSGFKFSQTPSILIAWKRHSARYIFNLARYIAPLNLKIQRRELSCKLSRKFKLRIKILAKFHSLNFSADLSLLKANLPYNLEKFQGAKVRKNIKYLIYKFLLGNVFLAVFLISFYVVSWHIENISNIDLMSLLRGYFLFPGDIRLPFTTAILELFAFYVSSSLSDFYVKEVDRKLNFIFFIAFATIGILALTAVTYIIVFGFMLFGLDLDKKLVAILSAVILFIGTYSTAFSFRKSNYELGKFLQIVSLKRRWNANEALSSILLFIGIIIWLNFIVFESK